MSSSRGSWFDVEDGDENEKLKIIEKMSKFIKKHAEIVRNVHLYTSQSLL